MTNPDYTAIAVLVDRSGSMRYIQSDAEGAINSFFDEQKKLPGRATVRVSQFDDTYEEVHSSVDIQSAPKFTLTPRGTTALNDSWARLIVDLGAELSALPEDERPGNVLFVVVTDGFENASVEYRGVEGRNRVQEMVKHQQDVYGWNFVFLAANQDAIATGMSYGLNRGDTLTYAGGQGLNTASVALSAYAGTTRTGRKAAFTEDDRKAAVQS